MTIRTSRDTVYEGRRDGVYVRDFGWKRPRGASPREKSVVKKQQYKK